MKTMRIVINPSYGGFSISRVGLERLAELGHPLAVEELRYENLSDEEYIRENRAENNGAFAHHYDTPEKIATEIRLRHSGRKLRDGKGFFLRDIERNHPLLLQAMDELGSEAMSGGCAKLDIVEVNTSMVYWEVSEYDGSERVVYPNPEFHGVKLV